MMQSKRFALRLLDKFGKESFQQNITLSKIGRAPTSCRNDLFGLKCESSRRGQAISGPKLGKEHTVGGCHPTLSARKV